MPSQQVVIMRASPSIPMQHGTSLIEVLITIVILAFGLLGLAGMQSRMQTSEMEAYQRSQALILLDDMANRIAANRNNASSYATGAASPLGTGMTCPTASSTRQERDSGEWCNALQGAGETESSGTSKLGAMIGARGCVESLGNNQYLVTVAWQGLGPLSTPPASVGCGKDSYDGAAGSVCVNDLCRRTLTTTVRIAVL
jgi:type IV pilus assembly protein PilV